MPESSVFPYHMISQGAFILCADLFHSFLRADIVAIGFKEYPYQPQLLKTVFKQQVFALSIKPGTLQLFCDPRSAYFQ